MAGTEICSDTLTSHANRTVQLTVQHKLGCSPPSAQEKNKSVHTHNMFTLFWYFGIDSVLQNDLGVISNIPFNHVHSDYTYNKQFSSVQVGGTHRQVPRNVSSSLSKELLRLLVEVLENDVEA